jgi:hypothetical protein
MGGLVDCSFMLIGFGIVHDEFYGLFVEFP